MRIISRIFNKIFGNWMLLFNRKELVYAKDNLYTLNQAPFMDKAEFIKAYQKGIQTDKRRFLRNDGFEWRVHVYTWAAKQAMMLEGDFLECGVRTGVFSTVTIELLDFTKQNKRFVMVDSFSGTIPDQLSAYEYNREKHAEVEAEVWEEVYREVKERWKDHDCIEVVKGVVPDVLNELDLGKLAFVSLDLNSALPEKAALEFIWPKLVPGGIIVLDDYGYPGFEEQQQVHEAFAEKVGATILCMPTCQGLIIKADRL